MNFKELKQEQEQEHEQGGYRYRNLIHVVENRMRKYRHNYRSRRQLLQLDERALKDIGLTRAEALREGRKPFWRCSTGPRTDRALMLQPLVAVSLFCSISLIIVISG